MYIYIYISWVPGEDGLGGPKLGCLRAAVPVPTGDWACSSHLVVPLHRSSPGVPGLRGVFRKTCGS